MNQEQFKRFVANISRSGDPSKVTHALGELTNILERTPGNEVYLEELVEIVDYNAELAELGSKLGRDEFFTDEQMKIIRERGEARKRREEEARQRGRC